jgi:hypothetical protein
MVRIAKHIFIAQCVLTASSVIAAGSCMAQEANVAHVLAVHGSVMANASGERAWLESLDGIRERTRIELMANSELRICHYPTRTQFTLKGPLRAEVWADAVTAENARAVERSSAPCMAPGLASVQGGHLSRGVLAAAAR